MLTGPENFAIWSRQVKALLMKNGDWGVIADDNSELDYATKLAWNRIVLGHMQLYVANHIPSLLDYDTAAGAWKFLEERYGVDSEERQQAKDLLMD